MAITTRQRDKVNDEIAATRTDLARKVLETVADVGTADRFPIRRRGPNPQSATKTAIETALRELFAKEGINVETK